MRVAVAAAALVIASQAAGAAEVPVETRIDAVTAYPDAALVTRAGEATLAAGEHVLVIKGLPARLDSQSVRVEGSASFGLEIGSVDLRYVDPEPVAPAGETEAQRRIGVLEQEHAALDDRITAAELRRRMIERFATAGTDGLVKGFGEGKTNAQVMKETFSAFGEALDGTLMAIRDARIRQGAIDEELQRIRKTLERDPERQRPSYEARIALGARGDGKAMLSLTYRVDTAGWKPVYEARLATGSATTKPALQLVTRAEVQQATGEDWNGVALTLSTARPSRSTAAAQLEPLTVQLWSPQRPVPSTSGALMKQDLGGAERARAPAVVLAPAPAPSMAQAEAVDARELQADTETAGTTVLYRVPGRVDVGSTLGVRALKVTEQTLEPALSVKAVPRVAPAGYLTAAVRIPGEAALLPGRVAIHRDGVFVGNGALPFVAAGDELRLGFGEDERIRVERSPIRQTEGETGTFSTSKTETRDFRIRVRNLRDRPIPVTVEDQIPVSELTEVTVERLSATTVPTKVNVDDRRGVLAWAYELKPGEEKEIRVAWRVSWPADKTVRWSRPQH